MSPSEVGELDGDRLFSFLLSSSRSIVKQSSGSTVKEEPGTWGGVSVETKSCVQLEEEVPRDWRGWETEPPPVDAEEGAARTG